MSSALPLGRCRDAKTDRGRVPSLSPNSSQGRIRENTTAHVQHPCPKHGFVAIVWWSMAHCLWVVRAQRPHPDQRVRWWSRWSRSQEFREERPATDHTCICCTFSPAIGTASIRLASSSGARELFTRRETGQHCSTSFATGFRSSRPAAPVSHASNLLGLKDHRHPVVQLAHELVGVRDD